jgi:hypothetical protein
MVATSGQLEMLRAMVDGDFDRHQRLSNGLKESGRLDGYEEVIGAAFYVAVRMQFPKRYCAEGVIRLVADTRTMFDLTGDVINPLWAERMVRCALGERGLVADIPDADVVQTQFIVCGYLAVEGRLGDPDVFMGEVQKLLDEWAADDEADGTAEPAGSCGTGEPEAR